jgi:hypothetical protein
MAGSGPAPNPNSRRQSGNQAHTWTDLPASGREGDAPRWPLVAPRNLGDLTEMVADRELEVWAQVWATPQAVAWERMGWTLEVALYVRTLVAAECGDLKAVTEARQWSDRLGLNPTAMLKNRWRVRADEVTERRETRKASPGAKARQRLKVADGAVAGS